MCDVFLPGVNGNTLHARVTERRPRVAARFVFVTGGALGASEADYLRTCGCPTLWKPVDLDDLLAHIERVSPDSVPPSVRTLRPSSGPSSTPPRSATPPRGR